MTVGNSALYRYKEGKPGGRRYDKAGNNQGLNGGGNKSTGGRQRKVLSKRNQEDKGANTDKA